MCNSWPYRFALFSRTPAAPDVPGTPVMCTLSSEATPNCQKPSFFAAILERQSTISWQRNQAGTRLSGVVFFLLVVWWGETYCAPNSLELESRLMPIGARTDHGPGAGNNRTICRYLGTESCFCLVLFSPTSSPLVPYLMLSSLPR